MWKSTEAKFARTERNIAEGKGFTFNVIDTDAKTIGICGRGL
jgi:hypothetical protein